MKRCKGKVVPVSWVMDNIIPIIKSYFENDDEVMMRMLNYCCNCINRRSDSFVKLSDKIDDKLNSYGKKKV